MAEQAELEISRREVLGKATKRLRKAGIIPANIFGHHEESLAVQIDAAAFDRFRRLHKAARLLTLRIAGDGATQTALLRHVQRDPRTLKILHVDFLRVGLDQRINVKVALRFVGESPAVKNEGGVLLHLMEALEVECRASEIPEFLEVDITPLDEIDAVLHASDVKLPTDVTLITDPNEPIAKVGATRAEMAEEAEVAEAAAAAPEAGVAAPPAEENATEA